MMFQRIEIFGLNLSIDPLTTSQAYESIKVECDCTYCRNFLAVSARLPKEWYDILQSLGIDPAKPAEIVEYTQNPDGSHYYSWWYHAVGRILADRSRRDDSDRMATIAPDITVRIAVKDDLAPADFPQPILQIEFLATCHG